MPTIDYIKKTLEPYLWAGITGAIGYLGMKILDLIIYPLLPQIYKTLEPKSALLLALLAFSLFLATFVFLLRAISKEKEYKVPEPTTDYGIYWDYMHQPLCPSCKAPLNQEESPIKTNHNFIPKLICPNGHFDKHLISNNIRLHPDKIRYEYFKINNMIK